SKDARGSAGSILDLDWSDNHEPSGGGHTSEVCDILQMKFTFTVNNVMHHEVRRHSVIDAQSVNADSRDISIFGEQLGCFVGKAREMKNFFGIGILVLVVVVPALIPARIHKNNRVIGNPAV